jgi:hypothetical protein
MKFMVFPPYPATLIKTSAETSNEKSLSGPRPPTWALQQVVSFLGYTGRAAKEKKNDANDP